MKKITVRIAHKRAEKVFNLWIRLLNVDINGNVRCFTCGKVDSYKNMDAGHYIANKLDFNVYNKHVQCTFCNRYKHGNLIEYTFKMLEMYGQEVVDKLRFESNQINKYSVGELLEIEAKYKRLTKEFLRS